MIFVNSASGWHILPGSEVFYNGGYYTTKPQDEIFLDGQWHILGAPLQPNEVAYKVTGVFGMTSSETFVLSFQYGDSNSCQYYGVSSGETMLGIHYNYMGILTYNYSSWSLEITRLIGGGIQWEEAFRNTTADAVAGGFPPNFTSRSGGVSWRPSLELICL